MNLTTKEAYMGLFLLLLNGGVCFTDATGNRNQTYTDFILTSLDECLMRGADS